MWNEIWGKRCRLLLRRWQHSKKRWFKEHVNHCFIATPTLFFRLTFSSSQQDSSVLSNETYISRNSREYSLFDMSRYRNSAHLRGWTRGKERPIREEWPIFELLREFDVTYSGRWRDGIWIEKLGPTILRRIWCSWTGFLTVREQIRENNL